MFNVVIFSAIGVFAALFLMVAGHFDATPHKLAEFTPSHVIASIEKDAKTNFMIAKSEGKLPSEANLIAKSGDQNWQIFSVAPEKENVGTNSIRPEEKIESIDFNNGLFSLISHIFSSL